jgi:hypothetical protein
VALQRAGEKQRVLIRRDRRRAFRREIAVWRPHVVPSWTNRATRLCARGDFVHLGRLEGTMT